MVERCRCRECVTGDALPDHLQGWPGAWQMTLFQPVLTKVVMTMPTIPNFQDSPKAREACAKRCALVGDAICWELNAGMGIAGGIDLRYEKPCGECLRDIGIEPGDEFDEAAAVARLL